MFWKLLLGNNSIRTGRVYGDEEVRLEIEDRIIPRKCWLREMLTYASQIRLSRAFGRLLTGKSFAKSECTAFIMKFGPTFVPLLVSIPSSL